MLRRILIVVLFVALAAWAFLRVQRQPLPSFRGYGDIGPRGVYHVHSQASHDCDVELEAIAAEAKALGLQFVVVADHNTQLAASVVIDGVTLVSAAEVSTPFGHVVQLGAADVVPVSERGNKTLHGSIRALGGVPLIAHPSDPKRPWVGPVVDAGGIEVVNFSSAARHQGGPIFTGLLPAFVVWRWRPKLALAQVYGRDDQALRRWDGESDPGFVGLCGVDAHGRIDLRLNMVSWLTVLERPLPSQELDRAAVVVDLLRSGRFHCVAGIFGERPRFEFHARLADGRIAFSGDTVSIFDVVDLVVFGPIANGPDPYIVILRDGEEVVRTRGSQLVYANPRPGTYRVEIRARVPGVLGGSRKLPLLYSNRIKVADSAP